MIIMYKGKILAEHRLCRRARHVELQPPTQTKHQNQPKRKQGFFDFQITHIRLKKKKKKKKKKNVYFEISVFNIFFEFSVS